MAYHPFEQICSLWLERVKKHFVIQNFPFRYAREKSGKFSPSTSTSDFDIISYDLNEPDILHLYECKSNINETKINQSKERLTKQLKAIEGHARNLEFTNNVNSYKKYVFAIKVANRIKKELPEDVIVIEGKTFEDKVLKELITLVGADVKMDPKDELLSLIRLLWHFGALNDTYYQNRAVQILEQDNNISIKNFRNKIGLIADKKIESDKFYVYAKNKIN